MYEMMSRGPAAAALMPRNWPVDSRGRARALRRGAWVGGGGGAGRMTSFLSLLLLSSFVVLTFAAEKNGWVCKPDGFWYEDGRRSEHRCEPGKGTSSGKGGVEDKPGSPSPMPMPQPKPGTPSPMPMPPPSPSPMPPPSPLPAESKNAWVCKPDGFWYDNGQKSAYPCETEKGDSSGKDDVKDNQGVLRPSPMPAPSTSPMPPPSAVPSPNTTPPPSPAPGPLPSPLPMPSPSPMPAPPTDKTDGWTCKQDGWWYENGKKSEHRCEFGKDNGGKKEEGSSDKDGAKDEKDSSECTPSENPGMPKAYPKTCINGPPHNKTRCWWTYEPPAIKSLTDVTSLMPLVVDLHGGAGCASDQAAQSGYKELAESLGKSGFITVWPQAYDGLWGSCGSDCAKAKAENNGKKVTSTDDLTFLSQMIDHIIKKMTGMRVDHERIYLTGFSMGCMMSHRLALERSNLIAGFGCHGGTLNTLGSDLSAEKSRFDLQPMPVYMTGGDKDNWFAMSKNVMDAWATWNGCAFAQQSTVKLVGPIPVGNSAPTSATQSTRWSCAGSNSSSSPPVKVVRLELVNGYHVLDKRMAKYTWDFLKQYRRSDSGRPSPVPPPSPAPVAKPAPTPATCASDTDCPVSRDPYCGYSCLEGVCAQYCEGGSTLPVEVQPVPSPMPAPSPSPMPPPSPSPRPVPMPSPSPSLSCKDDDGSIDKMCKGGTCSAIRSYCGKIHTGCGYHKIDVDKYCPMTCGKCPSPSPSPDPMPQPGSVNECRHDGSKCRDIFNDCCEGKGQGFCKDGYTREQTGTRCGIFNTYRYQCCAPTKPAPVLPALPGPPPTPTKFCANSPRQLCRMFCPTVMPKCGPGQCAMRFGACCRLYCVDPSKNYDCFGVPNGKSKLDCFGVCGGRSTVDCQGQCGGNAQLDCKGRCGGTAIKMRDGKCVSLQELYSFNTYVAKLSTREKAEQDHFDKMKLVSSGSKGRKRYRSKQLEKTERKAMLKKFTLRSDEELEVECEDEPAGCDLCEDGCEFENGAEVVMSKGDINLPATAKLNSALRVRVGKNARLRLKGKQTRALVGELSGKLDAEDGLTLLSNVTGSATINISTNATLVFEGSGDSNVTLDNDGETKMSGKTRFKNRVRSRGKFKVERASEVTFDSAEQTDIAGEGLHNEGKIRIGRGGMYVYKPIRSEGNESTVTVDEDAEVVFDSADQASTIGGKGLTLHKRGRLRFKSGKVAFNGPLNSSGLLHVNNGSSIEFTGEDVEHELGGEGVEIATGAAFMVHNGRMKVTSKFRSQGKLSISSEMSFDSGHDSLVGGEGAEVKEGGQVDVKQGALHFEGRLGSEGLMNISNGSLTLDCPETHEIGGQGVTLDAKARMHLKQGSMQLRGKLLIDTETSIVVNSSARVFVSPELYFLEPSKTGHKADIVLDEWPEKR